MRFLLKLLGPSGLAALVLLAVTAGAFAQESTTILSETIVTTPPPAIDSGDTAWMLASTALVLLMTIPGVALFYCGMVRKRTRSMSPCKASRPAAW